MTTLPEGPDELDETRLPDAPDEPEEYEPSDVRPDERDDANEADNSSDPGRTLQLMPGHCSAPRRSAGTSATVAFWLRCSARI